MYEIGAFVVFDSDENILSYLVFLIIKVSGITSIKVVEGEFGLVYRSCYVILLYPCVFFYG